MIVYSVSTLSRTGSINIGYATETGVTQIGFDCSTWLERWPDMIVEVWVTAPGAASAYEAKTHRKGDVIVWEVLQSDTQTSGAGRVEVIGYTADKRKLSATVNTRIDDSMLMAEGTEPPEAQQPWYTAAQEAKARAEALARHAPIIEDGMWMLWDPDKGAYVNSGVQAQAGSGLPEGAGPWMQVVTGADGVAQWEPRLAYAYTGTVEILPEIVPVFSEDLGVFLITEPLAEPLAPGMICEVTYNSMAYKCPVQEFQPDPDETLIALGNVGAMTGGEDTGEPFVFALIPDSLADQVPGVYAQVIAIDGAESVTIAITGVVEMVKTIDPDKMGKNAGANKALVTDENGEAVWSDSLAGGAGAGGGKYKQPEWGASTEIVDILPETTFEVMAEDYMTQVVEPLPYALVEGGTYEVNYNGTSYNCVCAAADNGAGGKIYMLGNLSAEGGDSRPDTGEPFLIGFYDEIVAAEMGFSGVIVPLDGSATITLSIKGPSGEIRTIPQKYVEGPLIVKVTDVNKTPMPLDTGIETIKEAINSGRNVYLRGHDTLFSLQRADMDSGKFFFVTTMYSGADAFMTKVYNVYQDAASNEPVAGVSTYRVTANG